MPEPRIEIRDGFIYRVVTLPEGQKRVQRPKKKAPRPMRRPIVHRDPGDESRFA